jgi:hypothetical protein
MYGFIFGFQRLARWPKCIPHSTNSFTNADAKEHPPQEKYRNNSFAQMGTEPRRLSGFTVEARAAQPGESPIDRRSNPLLGLQNKRFKLRQT